MITEDRKSQINEIFTYILEEIEISPSKYKDAENRYTAVGDWLHREASLIKNHSPEVYVQGSFRLGTAIKPISAEGEYDIDSVCVLDFSNKEISQAKLKEIVGNEIELYAQSNSFKNPVEEGRRCWTLNYSDDSKFHMDILPAIPFGVGFTKRLLENSLSSLWSQKAIAITDNKLPKSEYENISNKWLISNPKGYAEWFKKQMEIPITRQFSENRELQRIFASVEKVPSFRFKTPLQNAIQILKRHRDIMFADKEEKPISIIITTLGAHSYNNETNLFEALQNISNRMLSYIKTKNGEDWIENPVNPLENFADKWKEHPERKKAFFEWHSALSSLIDSLLSESNDLYQFGEIVGGMIGEEYGKLVMKKYGISIKEKRETNNLFYDKKTISIGDSGEKVKDHTFFE